MSFRIGDIVRSNTNWGAPRFGDEGQLLKVVKNPDSTNSIGVVVCSPRREEQKQYTEEDPYFVPANSIEKI